MLLLGDQRRTRDNQQKFMSTAQHKKLQERPCLKNKAEKTLGELSSDFTMPAMPYIYCVTHVLVGMHTHMQIISFKNNQVYKSSSHFLRGGGGQRISIM